MTVSPALDSVPLVSVVMSCFNDQETVEQAVRSIVDQSFENWELIAINDGSTDLTGQILDRLASQDSRIRVIHQQNMGLTRALIRGCALAQGEYIARQDADDRSHDDRLVSQVALLESDSTIGFVSCFARYLGPGGEFLSYVTREVDAATATEQLLNQRLGPPAHGSVMFRRGLYEQVGGYREAFYFAQDSDLWLRIAEVRRIAYVPNCLYDVQWRPVSITGSGRAIQREFGFLSHRCRQARLAGDSEADLLETGLRLRDSMLTRKDTETGSFARAANQQNMNYQIGSQLVKNRDHRARQYLGDVLRSNWFHWKAWLRLIESYLTRDLRLQPGIRA